MQSADPMLARGRVAWTAYAIIAAVVALSSAAPFVQLGAGLPRASGGDLLAITVYLASWVPFLAAALWLLRRVHGPAAWMTQLVLLLSIPAAHTIAFRVILDVSSGRVPGFRDMVASPGFQVLTLLGTLQYLVVLAAGIAVAAGRAADRDRAIAAELELERARLSERLTTAKLDALASQLRPHFLFNTLNSISVLTTTDPPAARAMIGQLSAMLRTVLSADDRPTIPLTEELRVLDAYLEIQRTRFCDGLDVQLSVDPLARDCAVPALILQPIVENAIEHAIAHRQAGGEIRVSVTRRDDRLVMQVMDNGAGGGAAFTNGHHEGIGLTNTRERLRQLYGADHRFEVEYARTGCTASIEFPVTSPAVP